MPNAILVLNAGSSSIKFSLFIERDQGLEVEVRGQASGLYTTARFVSKTPQGRVKTERSWPECVALGHEAALDHLMAYLQAETANDRLIGIGHRVVHGGERFHDATLIDDAVVAAIEDCVPLAPLHNPANLSGIRIARIDVSPGGPLQTLHHAFGTPFQQAAGIQDVDVEEAQQDDEPVEENEGEQCREHGGREGEDGAEEVTHSSGSPVRERVASIPCARWEGRRRACGVS
jgi:hypothetical protein